MCGGEKCPPPRRAGKREVSKLFEEYEAEGECMLLPSGVVNREGSDPVDVPSKGGECKIRLGGRS